MPQEPAFTNSLGLRFVLIPAGSFKMGAGADFWGDSSYERPQRQVRITKPFYLSVTEVTALQWSLLAGGPMPGKRERDLPKAEISHGQALEFAALLNKKEGIDLYRLPTEAEWEMAARAGSSSPYFFGSDPQELGRFAWIGEGLGRGSAHAVAQKEPSPNGLYDIYGNLAEWVSDWFGEGYYGQGPARDPLGPDTGLTRVNRGGSYASPPAAAQSASRGNDMPETRSHLIGLRLAMEAR
jgi:formylglycine-generating enzyme required for sulfatase activity